MEENNIEPPGNDLIEKITGYMMVGAGFVLATAACGIPEEVAMAWLKNARAAANAEKGDVYRKLHESIRSATAHAEVIALQRLSAEGGAAGAKWLLEKLYTNKYGKKETAPPAGEGGEWGAKLEKW